MRILLASAAAAAIAFSAPPAFAQYGGSPREQVEGAPNPEAEAPSADDGDQAGFVGNEAPDQADDADAAWDGPPDADDPEAGELAVQADGVADEAQGEDYAGPVDYAAPGDAGAYQDDADVDQDGDADADQDMDAEDAGPGDGAQGGAWRGEDGRAYCRRSDGTTGLVVGGGAGALVGRGIDGGRHRGTGTIIGAIAGALVGSAIERNANEQRCR